MAATSVFYIALCMCVILTSRTQAELGDCCPTFWTPFGETCYRLIAKPESWAEAEEQCQQMGDGIIPEMEGHLVSIHSQDESEFVQTYYKSSAVVQERRKKTIKPSSYNALWLGLNNQGATLDTFVWSDKTEVSTTFWQDTLYDMNHNCGHMWISSPSKYKGTWNDASCKTKLPFMCKLVPSEQDDSEKVFDGSSSYSSSVGLLPCSYRGTIILHEDKLILDECTSCICDNSTVRCDIKSCLPTYCEEPVRPEGECCAVCPDDPFTVPEELVLPCNFRGSTMLHRETVKLDNCTTCTCNDATVTCNILSCRPTWCHEPVHIDGECCDRCPYDVPVYNVELRGVDSVRAGTFNDIIVDLQVSLNNNGQSVQGSSLWKVGMWASRHADGSGKKIGFTEQVLTDGQASRNIQKPSIFDAEFEFLIPDINFSLDASGTSCKEIQYLCASFNKGDAPETLWESQHVAHFSVYGVESPQDSDPNPSRLIGCQQFTHCKDKGRKNLI